MLLGVGAYFAITCCFKGANAGLLGKTFIRGEASSFWW